MQCHDNFFERGVSGPFPNPVNSDLRLPGSGHQSGQGIRGRQAQVVVAVNGYHCIFNPRSVGHNPSNQRLELIWRGIADRIRDI